MEKLGLVFVFILEMHQVMFVIIQIEVKLGGVRVVVQNIMWCLPTQVEVEFGCDNYFQCL
jgi:hypothetical protein